MAKLLARNNRLKSRNGRLVTNDPGCKAACCGGGGGPCCEQNPEFDTYPGVTGHNTCGTLNGFHRARVTAFEWVTYESVNESQVWRFIGNPCRNFDSTPGTSIETRTKEFNRRLALNGQNCGTGNFCVVSWQVPVRDTVRNVETTTKQWTSFDNATTETCVIPGSYGSDTETCVTASAKCPAVGQHTAATGDRVPVVAEIATDLVARFLSGSDIMPPTSEGGTTVTGGTANCPTASSRTTVNASRSFSWVGTPTGIRYTALYTETERYSATNCEAGQATSPVSHSRERTFRESLVFEVSYGWDTDCAGTSGPGGCSPVPTDCDPNVVVYVIGTPCSSGSPPAVLPANNVLACGTAQVNGQCYRFDPIGPFTRDPAGFLIGSAVTTPDGPKTCCECNDACPKTNLGADQRRAGVWLNGSRDALTGEWLTYPAFVAGLCCCNNDDRFRLVDGYSTLESLPGGSVERWTFIDGATAGDFVRGFRRDEPSLSYLLSLTVDGQFAFTQPIGDISGPIGCEWNTPGGGGGGVQNYSFDRPLHAEGTHVRDNLRFGVPIPSDGVPNGDLRASGGWACMYYRLSATCTGLTAEAEWVRGEDLQNPVQRMRAKQVWAKTINASLTGPCTGGCPTLSLVPPATPTPPDGVISVQPNLRDLLGGI